MTLDWSTLLLEVINFLVLLWLLKRFFYQPLLTALDRRRQALDTIRDEAQRLHDEALDLKGEYEQRLSAWDEERSGLRGELQRQIEQERAQLLAEARRDANDEGERMRVATERQLAEQSTCQELQALELGSAFATRLLERLADPHLEQRLVELLIEELPTIAREPFRSSPGVRPIDEITVTSAFPLEPLLVEQLNDALAALVGNAPQFHYEVEPALVAGLRVSLDGRVLHANIADELKLFTEVGHEPE